MYTTLTRAEGIKGKLYFKIFVKRIWKIFAEIYIKSNVNELFIVPWDSNRMIICWNSFLFIIFFVLVTHFIWLHENVLLFLLKIHYKILFFFSLKRNMNKKNVYKGENSFWTITHNILLRLLISFPSFICRWINWELLRIALHAYFVKMSLLTFFFFFIEKQPLCLTHSTI